MSLPEIAPPIRPKVAQVAAPAAPGSRWKPLLLRIAITAVALVIWFWTQSLLGSRAGDTNAIGDGLHRLTAPVHSYLQNSPRAANALLIASSLGIDALGLL